MIGNDFPDANHTLSVINEALGEEEKGQQNPFDVDPLAVDYNQIVAVLRTDPQIVLLSPGGDVEPQRIQVDGNLATAWLEVGQPQLIEINLEKVEDLWRVVPATEGLFKDLKGLTLHAFISISP